MKKKNIANLIMVMIIMLIVAAGAFGVGHIRGWFDPVDDRQAVLTAVTGVLRLERNGVSYPAENNTALRTGDILTCQHGATAVVRFGQSSLTLGQQASVHITEPSASAFAATIYTGELFADCVDAATVSFAENTAVIEHATALFSVRSSAQTVSVLRGSVADASAGQCLQYIHTVPSVTSLDIHSLNDFSMNQIRKANSTHSLWVSNDQLDQLLEQRQAALEALLNSPTKPSDPTEPTVPDGTAPVQTEQPTTAPTQVPQETKPEETTAPETTNPVETTAPTETAAPMETTEPSETTAPTETTAPIETTEPSETTAPTETTVPVEPTKPAEINVPPETTEPTETTLPTEATQPPAVSGSCTIAIFCKTILSNMSDLEPGKAEFVPGDGVILSPVTVTFHEGETVFDVLKRVCDRTCIQLEYSWTPIYNSYYVEGINNLYEFDCGYESGWMYKVNGWFPNYGCSGYTLNDGDVIVWDYTCKGLGSDVGAPRMES